VFADSNPGSGSVLFYAIIADGIGYFASLGVRVYAIDASHRPKCLRCESSALDGDLRFGDRSFIVVFVGLTRCGE
jgi:hypothetical protein